MTRHDEDSKCSPCTRITSPTPGQIEPERPRTGTGNYYEHRCNKLPDHLAKPKISANDVTPYVPADALANPLEVKRLTLPKSKLLELPDQTDCFEAYTETETPLSTSNFAVPRPQKSIECHEALGMLDRRVHYTRRSMTRCKDTKGHYRLQGDELLCRQAQPRTSTGDIITHAIADVSSSLLEVEGLRLLKPRPLAPSDRTDSFKAHLSQPSISGLYTFTCTPYDDKGNHLLSKSNLKSQEFQNLMESPQTLQNQDQALANTLCALFRASKKDEAFIMSLTEVTDNASIKKYEFAPEYAELLTRTMCRITDMINDYWKAAGTTKVFSFGWSSNYDVEFSKLIYRKWATRLVLNSINDRVLARILLAKEVVEEFSTGAGCATEATRSTATNPTRMLNYSLQAEDLHWAQQLRQDRSAVLANRSAATVWTLSLEQLELQKDWDYKRHIDKQKPSRNRASLVAPLSALAPVEILYDMPQVIEALSPGSPGRRQRQKEPAPPENNVKEIDERLPKGSQVGEAVAKKDLKSVSPQERHALPLRIHCSSEDLNHRSHHLEITFKSETPTGNPVFHDRLSTPLAAGKMEERAPSLEQLDREKDQDYLCSLDKNCASSTASLLAQAYTFT